MIVELNDKSFDGEVAEGTVLIDFWAAWCGPCRAQAPILEEFDREYGDKIKICKLNVDENPAACKRFAVMSIPSILIFKGGELTYKTAGIHSKEQLAELI